VILGMAVLRLVRGRLNGRAAQLVKSGHREAAQALWVLVEEIDELLIDMAQRRR
jgi:hypothetical protein